MHEQPATESSFDIIQKLSAGEKDTIANGALYAVIQDSRPLGSAVKNSGLQNFAEAVFKAGQRTASGIKNDAKELMPSMQTFRNHLSKMVQKGREGFVTNTIQVLVRTGGGITCDGMKLSITGEKYYDLIAHWAQFSSENIFTNECDVDIKCQVLLLVPVTGLGTAGNNKTILDDALRARYGMDLNHLLDRHTFVTDCANTLPVVVGASSSSNKVPLSSKWIGCICHQLNTCMKKALDHHSSMEPFLTIRSNLIAAKNIVRIFKQSSIVLPTGLQLKQEVETRFSTIFLVIERFLQCSQEIRNTILLMPTPSFSLLQAYNDLEYELQQDSFATIRALNAIYIVCKPVADMQTVMERSNRPTLHPLVPMLEHFKNVLERMSRGGVLCLPMFPVVAKRRVR